MFFRGAASELRHRWFDGSWHASESLGGTLADTPAAVSWGPGRIDVFACNDGGDLMHRWFERTWHPWERIGGGLQSGPAVASWAPGRLDVFGRSSRGSLLHWWLAGGSWRGPEDLGMPPGADAGNAPAAVSWGPGRIDVVAPGLDATDTGRLGHIWYEGGWHSWDSLPGVGQFTPALSSRGPGRLDLIETDRTSRHYWLNGGAWHGPEPVAVAGTVPAAVSWNSARIDVFSSPPGGGLAHIWWDGAWRS